MKNYLLPLTLCGVAFLTACGGNSSSTPSTPITPPTKATNTFTLNLATKTSPAPTISGLSAISPLDATITPDPSQVQFLFGIAANQGGSLETSNSSTQSVDSYHVTTTIDGQTIGYGGVSQTFLANDPSYTPNSIQNVSGSGTVTGGASNVGLFMATFSGSNTTKITLTAPKQFLTSVNEVVLRMANNMYTLSNGGKLMTSPHVVYNNVMYTDNFGSMLINNDPDQKFYQMQYVLFVPASKIGANASYFVGGPNTVIDPVTNDTDGNWGLTDVSTWTAKDPATWISDPGCASLNATIDAIVAANPTGPSKAELVSYFQSYFIKFYKGMSLMFSNPSGILGAGTISASFEIIALDDITNGPLAINGDSTLSMIWDASNTSYSLNASVMYLQGQPPIKFTTSVTNTASN